MFSRRGNQKLSTDNLAHCLYTSILLRTNPTLSFMNNEELPRSRVGPHMSMSRFEGYMYDMCHEVENALHHTPARGWRHCIVSMGRYGKIFTLTDSGFGIAQPVLSVSDT